MSGVSRLRILAADRSYPGRHTPDRLTRASYVTRMTNASPELDRKGVSPAHRPVIPTGYSRRRVPGELAYDILAQGLPTATIEVVCIDGHHGHWRCGGSLRMAAVAPEPVPPWRVPDEAGAPGRYGLARPSWRGAVETEVIIDCNSTARYQHVTCSRALVPVIIRTRV